MYGLELIVIIFATLAQALCSNSYSINIVGIIIFWRVLMGIGKLKLSCFLSLRLIRSKELVVIILFLRSLHPSMFLHYYFAKGLPTDGKIDLLLLNGEEL